MKFAVCVLLLLGVSVSASADSDTLYEICNFNLSALTFGDYMVSMTAVSKYGSQVEMNPFMRYMFDRPVLGIITATGLNATQHYLMRKLWKEDKLMAWIFMVGLSIIKGYIIYHNIRVFNRMERCLQ